jgi:hypothetical protein
MTTILEREISTRINILSRMEHKIADARHVPACAYGSVELCRRELHRISKLSDATFENERPRLNGWHVRSPDHG